MKLKKALAKLSAYLSAKQREQLEERDSIKKVLKALKKKRDHLRERLEHSDNKTEQAHLQKKLEVITAQRQKGLQALKELKSERKASK